MVLHLLSCGFRDDSCTTRATVPVPSSKTDLPFAFDISMGVRKGDAALKAEVEQALDRRQIEIQKILKEYAVPLLEKGR